MNYISINVIMDRLTRHPLMQDLTLETVIDYAVDFMRIVGIPKTFIDKIEPIDIENYRGELPCDLYKIIQIRPLNLSKIDAVDNTQEQSQILVDPRKPALRYSTDSFHMSPFNRGSDFTYKQQGNCIITSFEKGVVEVAYKALPIDDNGYPLIPDDSTYTRALELYIKVQYFTIQYETGKITIQVLNKAEQNYAWAVGQAQSHMIMPSLDQMESISNLWNRLLPTRGHMNGFVKESSREQLKIH